METDAKILLVEDDPAILMTLRQVLAAEGYAVAVEKSGDQGLALAKRGGFDVVITDLRMPGLTGLELVRELRRSCPRVPILMMTGHGTTETAIEAIQAGAYDYLVKPFEIPELLKLVAQAVGVGRLMSEPVKIGEAGVGQDAIVGSSRAMQSLYKEIGRIAAKPVSVLIRGETGTGKELVARAIYQHSDRGNAPFVAINCAAIPETLLESELFGHERGAFTGAEARRIGRFEQANRGTIFLDEIGDMTPGTQVKLLRVLQEKTLQRLGGKETLPVDVRVIAATHRDLEEAIRQHQFREDLYYRLSVVVLNLPPLRARPEDIPDLVQYFLRKYAAEAGGAPPSIQPEAVGLLQDQAWPGNVRELENVIRKMLVMGQGYTIDSEQVRNTLARTKQPAPPAAQSLPEQVDELLLAAQRGEINDAGSRLNEVVERVLYARAIGLAHGNQALAARWLGVSRLTMREKLTQYGLHPKQGAAGE